MVRLSLSYLIDKRFNGCVIMIWFSLYVLYIYLSLILIAYGPSNKNILHGFPRTTCYQNFFDMVSFSRPLSCLYMRPMHPISSGESPSTEYCFFFIYIRSMRVDRTKEYG